MKNLLGTLLVTALMAFAGSAVRADTITFTTTGTFSGLTSSTGTTSTSGNGTGTATANFGNGSSQLLQIRYDGASQTAIAPPPSIVSLGIFHIALTGSGPQSGNGTFLLTINQTSPSGGSGSFSSTIAASFFFTTAAGGGGTVTFSTASTTINGVVYTLSNSGVVSLSVPPDNTGTFSSPGNSVEAVVVTVPEPASVLLLGTGLLGAAGVVRGRFKSQS